MCCSVTLKSLSLQSCCSLKPLIPKGLTLFHHSRWRRERGFWRPIAPDDHFSSKSSVSTGWAAYGLLPWTFYFKSVFIASMVETSSNSIPEDFSRSTCPLPVDINTPESTFVNHFGKFVIFLVHILCLCFLLSSALFLERSCLRSCGASCFEITSKLICLPCFSLKEDRKRCSSSV